MDRYLDPSTAHTRTYFRREQPTAYPCAGCGSHAAEWEAEGMQIAPPDFDAPDWRCLPCRHKLLDELVAEGQELGMGY